MGQWCATGALGQGQGGPELPGLGGLPVPGVAVAQTSGAFHSKHPSPWQHTACPGLRPGCARGLA